MKPYNEQDKLEIDFLKRKTWSENFSIKPRFLISIVTCRRQTNTSNTHRVDKGFTSCPNACGLQAFPPFETPPLISGLRGIG